MYATNPSPAVVLIQPSASAGCRNTLSLGYLSAILGTGGYRSAILDAADGVSLADFKQIVSLKSLQMVGIAAHQTSMPEVLAISQFIKSQRDIPIVIGGAQAEGMPEAGLEDMPHVDAICRGDGELVMPLLMDAITHGRTICGIPGTTTRSQSGFTTVPPLPAPHNLDDYPSPYLAGAIPVPKPHEEAVILTSRGCPHDCAFCVTPRACGRRIRYHSTERVIAEMQHCVDHGCHRFWVADPYFTATSSRSLELLRRIADANLNASIWCQTRANGLDDTIISLMVKAGVTTVAFGLESVAPVTLAAMSKDQDPANVLATVKKCQQAGMAVELMHIHGAPGDTLGACMDTMDAIREANVPFRGNSVGAPFQLYFGAAACDAPESFGIATPNALHTPSFMAPGTKNTIPSLSREDVDTITTRRMAEIELEQTRQTIQHAIRGGLDKNMAFSLPFTAMKEGNVYFPRSISRHGCIRWTIPQVDTAKASSSFPKISEILDQLPLTAWIVLEPRGPWGSCMDEVVSSLTQRLERHLQVGSVLTLVTPSHWLRGHDTREGVLRALKQLAAPSKPDWADPSIPLAKVCALVPSLPHDLGLDAVEDLKNFGIRAYPFCVVNNEATVEHAIQVGLLCQQQGIPIVAIELTEASTHLFAQRCANVPMGSDAAPLVFQAIGSGQWIMGTNAQPFTYPFEPITELAPQKG